MAEVIPLCGKRSKMKSQFFAGCVWGRKPRFFPEMAVL